MDSLGLTELVGARAAAVAGGAGGAAALSVTFNEDGAGVAAKAFRSVLLPGQSAVL